MTICTDAFAELAFMEARALGFASLRNAVVPHPLVGLTPAEVSARGALAVEPVVQALLQAPEATSSAGSAGPAQTVTLPESLEEIHGAFAESGWTDGLPFIPPTEARVEALLRAAGLSRDADFGPVPPRWARATAGAVAANAVMAGCTPALFPVVVAAVQAVLDPAFNLYGVQATTNPVAPLLIVGGPAARELGFNAGTGVFGPGFAANAVVGRALRLVLLNIGGGLPGKGDQSTLGSPAKYSYCIAENEQASPWPSLHEKRGYGDQWGSVTAFAGTAPFNMIDKSVRGEELLAGMASAMVAIGSNHLFLSRESLLVLCPDHAAAVARDGFTRESARRFLFDHAKLPLSILSPANQETIRKWRPAHIERGSDGDLLRAALEPEEIEIVVAGGPGNHSASVAGWYSKSVTRPIAKARL